MADEKVYTQPTIDDSPFPNQTGEEITGESSSSSKDTYSSDVMADKAPPKKRIAVEVIGTALNTQARKIIDVFEFIKQGAIQIGEYVSGISGDIRISPSGIVARNSAGNITFTLDGELGSAVFSGEIRSGTIVTGSVVVGNNSLILDGVERQIIVNDGTNDIILIGYQEGGF